MFVSLLRTPPGSTLFSYTTLFRSGHVMAGLPQHDREQFAHAALVVDDQDARSMRELLAIMRSEEHTSELQSLRHLVCRLLLEKKKTRHLKITRDCFKQVLEG